MASREHTMKFLLDAVVATGFHSNLSKAQEELSNLGREIQETNRLQADVSAYAKQEKAVQATGEKLENLQKQHDLLQKEIDETSGSTASLEREKLKLEQRITNTQAALERQNEKLQATGTRLQEAGIDTKDLASASQTLTDRLQELQQEQDEVATSAGSLGDQLSTAISAAGDAFASAGLANTLHGFSDAMGECVRTAADFHAGMSAVAALSGATGDELTALTAKAKEMGATTQYTALESAEAMQYMGMAGWSAQNMLDGLSGIMDLAAASGENLGTVSDIVTDALTAFGLQASDSAYFADVLAMASTKANTNVSMMGESFKYIAPLAGAMGYSVEDVAVALGMMANSGIKASQAGTTLRSALSAMVKASDPAAEAMEDLGLMVGDTNIALENIDGSAKGLGETIDVLRDAFSGLSETQQTYYAAQIFGTEAMSGMLALINASEDDFNNLEAAIDDCSGAAERMADIRMDNLTGDVTLLDSAFDGLKTTIGEEFTPELRGLTQAGTQVVGMLDSFVQEHPAAAKAGMTLAASFLGLATAVTGVSAALKAFQLLNIGALLTGPAGAVVGITAAVSAGAAALVGYQEALRNSLDESWELTPASRDQYQNYQDLEAQYQRQVDAWGEDSPAVSRTRRQRDDAKAAYETGKQTYTDYQSGVTTVLERYGAVASDWNQRNADTSADAHALNGLIAELESLTSSPYARTQNKGSITAVVDRINQAAPGLNVDVGSALTGGKDFVASLEQAAKNEIHKKEQQRLANEYTSRLQQQSTLSSAKAKAEEQLRLAQQQYHTAKTNYDTAMAPHQEAGATNSFMGNVGVKLATMPQAAELEEASQRLAEMQTNVGNLTQAWNENESALSGVKSELENYTAEQSEAAEGAGPLIEAVETTMQSTLNLGDAYNEAYEKAKTSFDGMFGLFETAQADADATVAKLQETTASQIAFWETYNANIDYLKSLSAEDLNITQSQYNEIIKAVSDGSTQAAGLAESMVQDIKTNHGEVTSETAVMLEELALKRNEAAEDTATWVTGIDKQMDGLVESMKTDVQSMDYSDEAREAARLTLQSYVNKIRAMTGPARSAAQAVADAVADALYSNGPSVRYRGATTESGPQDRYASGTASARPGFALVGEEGPEIVLFRGGEQVITAQKTRELLDVSQRLTPLSLPSDSLTTEAETDRSRMVHVREIEDLITQSQRWTSQTRQDISEQVRRSLTEDSISFSERHSQQEENVFQQTLHTLTEDITQTNVSEQVRSLLENHTVLQPIPDSLAAAPAPWEGIAPANAAAEPIILSPTARASLQTPASPALPTTSFTAHAVPAPAAAPSVQPIINVTINASGGTSQTLAKEIAEQFQALISSPQFKNAVKKASDDIDRDRRRTSVTRI